MIVGKKVQVLQKSSMKMRDERMKIVNEVFGNMKIIKLYSWEESFGIKIQKIREKELKLLREFVAWSLGMSLFWTFAPQLVTLSSFASYTAAGNKLNATVAFTSLALFNLLRFPLAVTPMIIIACIDASVSFGRINRFLSSSELDPNVIEYDNQYDIDNDTHNNETNDNKKNNKTMDRIKSASVSVGIPGVEDNKIEQNETNNDISNHVSDVDDNILIKLKDCSFSWGDNGAEMALEDINCHFQKGTITMIIGETGSGMFVSTLAIISNYYQYCMFCICLYVFFV